MAAECQPVNKSGYHCGVLKELCPFGEWQVCGHNGDRVDHEKSPPHIFNINDTDKVEYSNE